jgi:hypothetical protein
MMPINRMILQSSRRMGCRRRRRASSEHQRGGQSKPNDQQAEGGQCVEHKNFPATYMLPQMVTEISNPR